LGAFAEVAALVAVAKLSGFVHAGGGAGRDGGAAHGAVGEEDVGFDGGVATGVQNFSTYNFDNVSHFDDPAWEFFLGMGAREEGSTGRGAGFGVTSILAYWVEITGPIPWL
jgi:hypothetical protein